MKGSGRKVGSVLVVGGGIGGMQAALDLAESGVKVYLLERKTAIGGVMSQLDKTFPTNDCAMCTISPRLIEVGSHRNIEIITNAELEELKGEAGDFQATIRVAPSFVDLDKCTGCGLCSSNCPVTVADEYNYGLSRRTAIFKLYPQAVPNKYAIDRLGTAPCQDACPVHGNPGAYVALVAAGRYQEAYDAAVQNNPFPSICGRVCMHFCEQNCNRTNLDEPVSIAFVKRFLADWHEKNGGGVTAGGKRQEIKENGVKVAVVGAGPAGLTAALELRKMGYGVTVVEKQDRPGGMMRFGIPAFRLPDEVLQRDIQNILDHGVELRTGVEIKSERDIGKFLEDGYKSVFLSFGAWKSTSLGVPGEKLENVRHGIHFLRDVRAGATKSVGKRVVVIGGGNVAIDSARSAVRLGGGVTIVYRRAREQMPAFAEEVHHAEEEGVGLTFLAAPVRLVGDDRGRVKAMECVRMKLGEPDQSGRRRPIPVEGSEFTVDADEVILAIGQDLDVDFLKGGRLKLTKKGTLEVDRATLMTGWKGVFAGGDVVRGPASIIEAVADGQRAALAIDAYARGGRYEPRGGGQGALKLDSRELGKRGYPKVHRNEMPRIPVERRKTTFDETDLGFTEEMAREEAKRCLFCTVCCDCQRCQAVCEAGAILYDDKPRRRTLEVGSVILASGFEPFDARLKSEYGYGIYPNVVTALEFERILSASGPFQGKVARRSDGKAPERIAWIQCVGSRDSDRDFCSSVCCMYATKEAIIAKEHVSEKLVCDIYFMDLRAFGKGFDEYYERAKAMGVTYIRCRPSSVEEAGDTKNLVIKHLTEDGRLESREYDMVVLSTGLGPPAGAAKIAERLGVALDGHGFCRTEAFSPCETSVEGVLACGPFVEPKDIPETVMEASGAAAKALNLLAEAKGSLIRPRTYPSEIDVTGQEPRIGVFVCHCGTNIGGVVNVPEVVDYARSLPNVVHAEDNLYTCAKDAQERIKKAIREKSLNRVVVASCTPRTHEPLFRSTLRDAGLNPYLFEMANIRDQCSWVHMHEPVKATKKAKDLVRMALAKSRLLEPLERKSIRIERQALVIGGGPAGMTAALELAGQGFNVHLVEKERELGGNLRHVHHVLEEDPKRSPRQFLAHLVENVRRNPKIALYLGSKLSAVSGFIGNFESRISSPGGEVTVKHGVIIVATGAVELKPGEYLYGQDPDVLTQVELEERLAREGLGGARDFVMIQCVGSRDKERPYCSRICCQEAVKNALKIKELDPAANVYVIYRDVRTYGFKESYYTKARQAGVVFIRYDEDRKPTVGRNGRLVVRVLDPILGLEVAIPADRVVLSVATVPNPGNPELAQLLKVPLNQNGFFLEAHMKLRPVDFATEGVFLAGMAHSPKIIAESIVQASAAVSRASTILSKEELELEGNISSVIDENCDGCAYCIDPCPYKALTLIEYMRGDSVKKTVEVNEALCKGCGTCMATCPKRGIMVKGFRMEQLSAMVGALLEGS